MIAHWIPLENLYQEQCFPFDIHSSNEKIYLFTLDYINVFLLDWHIRHLSISRLNSIIKIDYYFFCCMSLARIYFSHIVALGWTQANGRCDDAKPFFRGYFFLCCVCCSPHAVHAFSYQNVFYSNGLFVGYWERMHIIYVQLMFFWGVTRASIDSQIKANYGWSRLNYWNICMRQCASIIEWKWGFI